MGITVVEPDIIEIGLVTDSDEVQSAKLNAVIASGYSYFPGSRLVTNGIITGEFKKDKH